LLVFLPGCSFVVPLLARSLSALLVVIGGEFWRPAIATTGGRRSSFFKLYSVAGRVAAEEELKRKFFFQTKPK
jgi:hypothetical protein